MKRALITVGIALAIAALCGVLASRLALRPGLADLLKSNDPVAQEFARITDRLPSTLMMVVTIEGPDRDANLRAADDIGRRLETLKPRLVDTVIANVKPERAFFDAHKWLYLDVPQLEAIRDNMKRRQNPLLVDIDDEPIVDRAKLEQIDKFPSGYFEGENGHFVVVLVRPVRAFLGEDTGRELRDEAQKIIADVHGPKIDLGGSLIVGLGEREALMRDLARASLACLVLVALVVILFFGRFRVLLLFAVPALIGVTVGYAMAWLVWGFVNMSAAFMGTIIVGNGINFAIIQQARYDEERRKGTPDAARVAVRATRLATLVAALGAAAAYGSLTLTQFRGFSQFGAVGATGMITAWVATIVVLPALWRLFDHGSARQRFSLSAGRLAMLARHPRIVLAVGAVAFVIAIAALPGYLGDPFEYDLSKLRDRSASASTTQNARVEAIFGQSVSPPVLLADTRAHVPEIVAKLRAKTDGNKWIASIRSIDDFVPPDQVRRLVVIADIRALMDKGDVTKDRPPDELKPFDVADLPSTVRNLFSEVDGTVGRIVLVYDRSRLTAYDGHAQIEIDELVGETKLSDGTVARCPILFAALLRGIAHDAPIATLLSLLGVIVLVALLERSARGVGLVVGSLVLGVAWMVGAAAWLGVRVNFLNFIALPITLGIGVDYAINMYRRSQQERDIVDAVRGVGGALVLCSLTTVIGYGSLLAADNQALASFGAMAILGEIATLLAAITMLPAALQLAGRRAT